MNNKLFAAAGAVVLTGTGMVEAWLQRSLRRAVPIWIHVHGIRGASRVTRLIAAGLRAGGIRTCARTSSPVPRFILPDGSEQAMFHSARPTTRELVRVVRAASRLRAEAIVIECVTQPARTVRATEVVELDDDAVATVGWDEMDAFPYVEHPENVALALNACQGCGVSRTTALRGMWSADPDPGVMTIYRCDQPGESMLFINAFGTGDVPAAGKLWQTVVARYGSDRRRVAILNCRAEQSDKVRQLAQASAGWNSVDHVVAIGSATDLFAQQANSCGLPTTRLTCCGPIAHQPLTERLRRIAGPSGLLVGLGDASGAGWDLVQHFRRQHDAAARKADFARFYAA